jgi:hypothetical protein
MRKILFSLFLFITSISVFSQNALEGVLVEKVNAGALGTTYRVFVDMAVDWKLSSVYSVAGHEMFFGTTTSFYNHPDFGVTTGHSLLQGLIPTNPELEYDSYVTISAASSQSLGVPRSVDPDGRVPGTLGSNVTGLTGANFGEPFGTATYTPAGGRWSTLAGQYYVTPDQQTQIAELPGADAQNRIYIGQFTTTGDFSFEINVQLRNTVQGITQRYVARDPVSGGLFEEYEATSLRYSSVVVAPVINWISPAAGNYITGDPLNLSVDATDGNGTVNSVQFYRNSVAPANLIATPPVVRNVNTFTITGWPAVEGTSSIIAVATDNDGNVTQSSRSIMVTTPANNAPVCNLVAPTDGELVPAGSYTLRATATDVEGMLRVEFWVGPNYASAVKVGEDANILDNNYEFPYTFAPGAYVVYAKAIDAGGRSDESSVVAINVFSSDTKYIIQSFEDTCYQSEIFCMPILTAAAVDNVIGYDMILGFEGTKVQPTGVIYVSNDLLEPANGLDYSDVTSYVNIDDNQMNISLAFNSNANANAEFQGAANRQLICVEFARTGLTADGTATFTMLEMSESKVTGLVPVAPSTITAGVFTSVVDRQFTGKLNFWKNNEPIVNVPGANLPVHIYPATSASNRLTPYSVNDENGEFITNVGNGDREVIKIVRQIENGLNVHPILTGADAQLVARMVMDDPGFRPKIYQMYAMDVNRDRRISAGDISQIMLRAVKLEYGEFKQTDTYNDDGTKNGPHFSKDWLFMTSEQVIDATHRISATFPEDDDVGYSRKRVPLADTALNLQVDGTDCLIIQDESFIGVMIGDADGSYAELLGSYPELKSTEKSEVVFDLARARMIDGYIEIPVFFNSDEEVTSVDFELQFDESTVSYSSLEKKARGLEAMDYFDTDDRTLRFTSYSLKSIDASSPVAMVRFNTHGNEVSSSDLRAVMAMVNGKPAKAKVTDAMDLEGISVDVYPNPASSVLHVEVSADAKVVLMDMTGRSILFEADAVANQKQEINVSGVVEGMYMLKVYNEDFSSMKKIVIKR